MNISRTTRALAIVPMLGALALGPGVAFANQEDSDKSGRHGERHERMLDRKEGRHMHMSTTTKDGIRGLFHRNGMRHHGKAMSEEAVEWNENINTSIKNDEYDDFKDEALDTPLGDATTKSIFDKLALASDHMDDGKFSEARDIMKSLRDSGYHFKKLIHESLKALFSKNE